MASRISLNKSSSEAFTNEQLFYIIGALTTEISRLDTPNSNELVSSILEIKWTQMGSNFINAYVRFLTVLVSGVPRWWFDVTTKMVEGFQEEDDTSAQHLVIRHILKLMPTVVSSLQSILSNNFPHKTESKPPTIRYLNNLLKVVDYAPELRSSIWSLIFERVIQLDVELQDLLLDSDEEDDEEDDEDEDEEDDEDDEEDEDEDEMGTPPSSSNQGIIPHVKHHEDINDDEDDGMLDVSKIVQANSQSSLNSHSTMEDTHDSEKSQSHKHNDRDGDEDDDEIHGVSTLFDDDEDDYEYDIEGGIDVLAIRNKLDAIMTLLFDYVEKKITPEGVSEEHGEAQILFTTLLAHFQSYILSTHRTRSVQFLLFRAAHAHPALLDAFLVSLIEIALSPSEVMDKRLKAMQYISSFIARAKGLSRIQILFVVSILVDWVKRYVEEREGEVESKPGSMGRFKMFYAVSQALMYIFCFRHTILRVSDRDSNNKLGNDFKNDINNKNTNVTNTTSNRNDSTTEASSVVIRKSSADSEWECNLDKLFQRIVISKFNPLRYCRDTVVSKFAQLALRENLVYCFTIMEQNRLGSKQQDSSVNNSSQSSLSRPSAINNSDVNGSTSSLAKYMFHTSRHKDFVMLDAYFPFDPMHLPNSKRLIDPIYVEWVADEEDSDSEEADDDEEGEEGDDDEEEESDDGESSDSEDDSDAEEDD